MGQYTVTLTEAEEKALLTDMASIEGWLINAIHTKASRCMDRIILNNSDRQPSKLSSRDREQIVMSTDILSAVERDAEIMEKQDL